MSNNLSFKDVFIKGAIIYNPVLIQLVGLCPVVAASTSLARAAMLSVVLCIELVVTCVVASAFFKKLPRWIRVPLYLIIGMVIICPILWYIEARSLIDLSLSMKIYIPLLAVNSMTAVHCEQFSVKNSVKLSLYDAAAAGFGASIVFLVVGAVRELLGSSAIGGIHVNLPITFKGMTLPFGCLMLLGFLAVFLKAFVSRINSEPDVAEAVAEEEISADENSDVTEVEIFDEFWNEPEQKEEVPQSEPQYVAPQNVPERVIPEEPQEVPLQFDDGFSATGTKDFSAAEIEKIEELFKSLGLDVDAKGDSQ